MAIFEVKKDGILRIEQTTFEQAGLRERDDLQRLLRAQIDVVCDDVLVIAEGFRDWEDSRREIDLLAVDKDANLVVIELKRTEDAGHAELQAIRYAAMVSTMTFEKAVEVFGSYLAVNGGGDAGAMLLEFLGWEEPEEDSFAQDVHIILVAADFSRELTTSVMWLNERALDIRCVRMRPHRDGDRVLVDVQQVIPLPEAQDYLIRIREKSVRERQDQAEQGSRHALRQAFWEGLLNRSADRHDLFRNISASQRASISRSAGFSRLHYTYSLCQYTSAVRFYVGEKHYSKARFDWLENRRKEIEREFGGSLQWERCDKLNYSHIGIDFEGGYRNDPEQWPAVQERMIDAMIRLEKAMAPFVPQLRIVTHGDGDDDISPDVGIDDGQA